MTKRDELRAAVETLPDNRLDEALRKIRALSQSGRQTIGGFDPADLRASGIPVTVGAAQTAKGTSAQ